MRQEISFYVRLRGDSETTEEYMFELFLQQSKQEICNLTKIVMGGWKNCE